MAIFKISINQLIEASRSTENAKTRIVKQQIVVNKVLAFWYQLAKNRIKKYFLNVKDLKVLEDCITILNNKVPKDLKEKRNIVVSIEALQKVIGMHFNEILVDDYEVVEIGERNLEFEDISVGISPDLVYRVTEDGIRKVGALKFRVSKTKPFNLQQSKLIANLIKIFLTEKIALEGEVVDEKLCWAYDVFTDRLVHADLEVNVSKSEIITLCKELKEIFKNLDVN